MTDPISFAIAVLALAISGITAWFTLFHRGTVKMTQPTQIFFGPDAPRNSDDEPFPKVYLKTLLFATSKRGRVIENMYVSLSRNETKQNFSIWTFGKDKLQRGSGLYVGETGVEANHHFLTPPDQKVFKFLEGKYRIDVYARLLGANEDKLLFSHVLEITHEVASRLEQPDTGLYFDWGPDSQCYMQYLEKKPNKDVLDETLQRLFLQQPKSKRK